MNNNVVKVDKRYMEKALKQLENCDPDAANALRAQIMAYHLFDDGLRIREELVQLKRHTLKLHQDIAQYEEEFFDVTVGASTDS